VSTFYDLLEKKATNLETKDRIVYINGYDKCESYSYKSIYEEVNFKLIYFSEDNEKARCMKRVYLVVNNSIESIVMIIALLKCHFMPIIIDSKAMFADNQLKFLPQLYLNQPVPVDVEDEIKSALIENPESFASRKQEFESVLKESKFIETKYEKSEIPSYDPNKSQIVICTSGSEGTKSHFVSYFVI